jgi:Fic family protein
MLKNVKFKKDEPYNLLPDLPPKTDLNSTELLKASIKANRLLGELKGYCQTLPDPKLLINTIALQESKDSSEIENIVTTQDELYRAVASVEDLHGISVATKEVLLYREALYIGVDLMKTRGITTNTLTSIMQKLKNTSEGIRRFPGTRLANADRAIIYTPPDGEELLRKKMFALEKFIHQEKDDIDPLIKMALVHYQFEAIHPFSDGNGRTGRILNVLFLLYKELLTLPVLYISSYIIKNKKEYYRLLKEVTENGNWKEWILYMLNAVSETSLFTLNKITAITNLKKDVSEKAKVILGSSYTRDLIDLLFSYPYCKIMVLEKNGIAHRQTASLYLSKLADAGLLKPIKIGKEIYYINYNLMNLISNHK